ncbi:MAG: glycine cleavage system protein H [Promethearchaeota archaeon]
MIFNVVEEEDKFKVTIEKFILKFPKNLFYSKDDMWVSKDDEIVVIGATDYFQTILSDILFLEMESAVGDEVGSNFEIGALESVKTVLDVIAPVGGEIVAINEKLEKSPEIVNKSAYQDGWILKIKPGNLESDLSNLLTADEYVQLIKEKAEKHYERKQRQKEI